MKKIVMSLALLGSLHLNAATSAPMPIRATQGTLCYTENGTCLNCLRGTKDMFHQDDQWTPKFGEETDE